MTRDALAGVLLAAATLGGCAYDVPYGPPPPLTAPAPAGWIGENWARHVARCARRYPRYDPRTDLIYRRAGAFRCPL